MRSISPCAGVNSKGDAFDSVVLSPIVELARNLETGISVTSSSDSAPKQTMEMTECGKGGKP